MALTHGASLIQSVILMAMGAMWHSTFGFEDKSQNSKWAKWINLYGMWANSFGILWGAVFGAKDLFYVTKEMVSYQAPEWAEAVLHVLLKSQGLCNIIAYVMIIKQFSKTLTSVKSSSSQKTE